MGVYIKGLKMPENCCGCLLKEESTFLQGMGNIVHCGWVCGVTREPISEQGFYSSRLLKCPLVEVPEPHGRLIDVNDAKSRMIPLSFSVQKWIGEVGLSNCETVIEAEDGT